jgi:hypothetical protein
MKAYGTEYEPHHHYYTKPEQNGVGYTEWDFIIIVCKVAAAKAGGRREDGTCRQGMGTSLSMTESKALDKKGTWGQPKVMPYGVRRRFPLCQSAQQRRGHDHARTYKAISKHFYHIPSTCYSPPQKASLLQDTLINDETL